MATYMIFIREDAVFNAEEMALYQAANRAGPPNPDITPLVMYGKMEALEGDAPDGMVILRFPDEAAARAWYDSPAYQAAAEHRKKAAHYRAIMVEGF